MPFAGLLRSCSRLAERQAVSLNPPIRSDTHTITGRAAKSPESRAEKFRNFAKPTSVQAHGLWPGLRPFHSRYAARAASPGGAAGCREQQGPAAAGGVSVRALRGTDEIRADAQGLGRRVCRGE